MLTSDEIKNLRKNLGLGQIEFANLLGMNRTGERTVRGWESGEHVPTKKKEVDILQLKEKMENFYQNAPFKSENDKFKFIDLFAGIGGIRLPFQELGGKCVFTSEFDKFAQKTYLENYGEMPSGDITKISSFDIPNHDLLLAGFPCQAFSQAGLRKGFHDTRGTMFFEVQRILVEKRPKMFLLENVKKLITDNKGKTLDTMLSILQGNFDDVIPDNIPLTSDARNALSEKLNYCVGFKVLKASDFGIPQHRERVFIVGFDRDYFNLDQDSILEDFFDWPIAPKSATRVSDILQSKNEISLIGDKYTISDKLWKGHQKRREEHKNKGNGFGYSLFKPEDTHTNTISARYYKDGSEALIYQNEDKNPRFLTQRECARLQGFPEDFIVDAVSKNQMYKQFGNSVCMAVVKVVAKSMIDAMDKLES